MKILLYTQYFPPENNAQANRWEYFCHYLVNHGHEVTVLTSFPSYPLHKLFPGYKRHWCFVEKQAGLTIFRTWTFLPGSFRFLANWWHQWSFALTSYFNSYKIGQTDVLIISAPPLVLGSFGLRIAKKRKIPVILDLRSTLETFGYSRAKQGIYHEATLILVDSPALLKDLRTTYALPAKKVMYLPNGADLAFFAQEVDTSFLERQYNLYDKFIVLYTGLVEPIYGLETVVAAAHLLKDQSEIVFIIVGAGSSLEKLKIKAKKLKLTNVIFTGLRPHEEMPQYIALADVCLLPFKNKAILKNNLPSKMFDYLAAGKPIITNLEGEASHLLLEAQAGILVQPENPQALADSIITLQQDKFLRHKMGQLARTYAENNFNREEISQKLEEIITALVS